MILLPPPQEFLNWSWCHPPDVQPCTVTSLQQSSAWTGATEAPRTKARQAKNGNRTNMTTPPWHATARRHYASAGAAEERGGCASVRGRLATACGKPPRIPA